MAVSNRVNVILIIFQDAASIPGARSKTTPNTQPLQPPKVPSIKVTKTADSSNRQDRIDQDRHHSHSKTGADRYTTKSDSKSSSLYKSNSNHLEIKGSILEISISSQAIHFAKLFKDFRSFQFSYLPRCSICLLILFDCKIHATANFGISTRV